MAEALNSAIRISPLESKNPNPKVDESIPEHWENKAGTAFKNPWKSFRPLSVGARLGLIPALFTFPSPPKDIATLLPTRKPTWGQPTLKEGEEAQEVNANEKIKATWLGHACFLVELPSSEKGRGVRILFDPVFSDRCSPSQWIGPKRFTPPPCKIEDIPEIDAVVISHNHYDHLDTHTIRTLLNRTARTPHFFAPLGNAPYFQSLGVPTSHTHIMDWWESKRLEVKFGDKGAASTTLGSISLSLGGWVVEEVRSGSSEEGDGPGRPATKVYFAGDTGYRAVLDGEDEEKVPVCPAFEAIGNRFGGFDCALIPIGAYLPRQFMSRIHCAPQDSVRLFKDLKAKKAVGMHWGTWILTAEDVVEPPKRLAEECKKAGIEDGAFTVCDIGETLFF
ncbi:N-acyl-phosphatidylethanolamine-hydrolyzing phospholipase D [Flammula alnicola]|nr:N-acyl-phosphatidylethanolamine-hydrolyzing phospholipase D [Flammula alnicola]